MTTRELAHVPDGVSKEDFLAAIAKFEAVVGADNVLTDEDRLTPYFKTMMPVADEEYAMSAVLQPTSTEQVQDIVRICNEFRVPVWPTSTGRNFGYGTYAQGNAKGRRHQVVIDFRHMNRILEVDAELGTALLEPGVTYQQLVDYLEEHNIPLWVSCPAPSAIASPVGNTLDRGVGYTPYGEHFMMQCGMEVVLPDGEVLRTAMGGVEGSNSWQVFKWGFGPYLDGIFTQSNYGIVTKMGLWLMHKPPAYKPFYIRFNDDDDIAAIVDMMRPLRLAQIIPNAVVFAHALWEAPAIIPRSKYYDGKGAMPVERIEAMKAAEGIGAWNVYAALYGTPEQIEVNWKIVTDAVKALGKGEIFTAEDMGDKEPFAYRAALMRGGMSLQEFGLYRWRGGGGSMWFAPVTVAKGSETRKQTALATRILNKWGFDYCGEYIVGMRDMHHVIDLLFDKTDEEDTKNAHACMSELIETFRSEGYAVYRTNNAFMDQVADCYGPVQRRINQTLKRALDPNGIIAPGKSGIDI
ncbi:FAD-binding protein [Paracoccus limosus]|uniref:FAD-binding protein n=1 Tax=Paracoccus limosus TaxID=913252 RepID=A0A844HAB2_9RHOB|nr:FAD-binding oxidoreductase [Paracoccus limosus]MTH35498.1 FAD-binding protein [Paracoccus limosus]